MQINLYSLHLCFPPCHPATATTTIYISLLFCLECMECIQIQSLCAIWVLTVVKGKILM
jgi:hypothetical protein